MKKQIILTASILAIFLLIPFFSAATSSTPCTTEFCNYLNQKDRIQGIEFQWDFQFKQGLNDFIKVEGTAG